MFKHLYEAHPSAMHGSAQSRFLLLRASTDCRAQGFHWHRQPVAMVAALALLVGSATNVLRSLPVTAARQVGAFIGAASQLVVWNVLTRGTWWSLPVAVSCLAADPAGEHFAVAIVKLASAAEGDDEQSPEATADLQGAQAVLAFRPESPQPIHSWASRQPLSAVLFTQPATAVRVAYERIAPQVSRLRCCMLELIVVSAKPHRTPSWPTQMTLRHEQMRVSCIAIACTASKLKAWHCLLRVGCACRACRRCWW